MIVDETGPNHAVTVRCMRSRSWLGWLITALALVWAGRLWAQPNALWLHSAIYDPPRQRMVLFGGTPDSQILENETWQLTLGNAPTWGLITPQGSAPSGRLGHSAIYDPVRDRMIVFGGLDDSRQIVSDLWAISYSNGSWTQLQPSGAPPPARRYHSAVYDPARDRMIVFGGDGGFGNWFNDVWSLWLSPSPRWERILPKGALPAVRYAHSAIYDPSRDRMIVFGGNRPFNDVWALSFADTSWALLSPTGSLPTPRFGHTAIFDSEGDRMVVFGGFNGNESLEEVWLLSLAGPEPGWSRFISTSASPSVRQFHTAVYDSVYRRMVVFGGSAGSGGQTGVSEPTWALSLDSSMRWSPERPAIDVAPSFLTLQTVTVGDTVSVPFSVANVGLQPLQIQGFQLPAAELRLSSPSPSALSWNTALSETLWLAAKTPGVADDSLVIVSNDPLVPRRRVDLHLDVRGLDFSTRVLDEPDSVPPGISFIVVVTPNPGVVVERGTLYYRLANGASAFDSLTLKPLATDYIAAIPAAAVTERGVDYYVRIENSGFSAARPVAAPTAFFTQKVAAPTSLTAVIPRPTGGSEFLAGQPIEVDVELPDGAIFDSGEISYRRGGESKFQSLELAPTGITGQVAAVIPDSMVGPRGLEYQVSVTTLRSTLTFPATSSDPATIRIRVPNLSEPSAHAGGRYRLLSVPLDFGLDFTGSLDALLADQFGSYDPTRWRVYTYDPATEANVEFSLQQATRFRPAPGRSFWLISRDAHRVDTKPIGGLSTPTETPYGVALAPGWNLIGDPYDFPVAWSEVGGDTAFVSDPVAFDPSRGTIGDYSDVTPVVLSPFEGYFIHATQTATLQVPPRAAPASLVQTAAAGAMEAGRAIGGDSADGWRVRVRTRTEAAEDGANTIGLSSGTSAGYDPMDLLKPPLPPGPWVRIAITHPEWGEQAGEYRRDLRPPGTSGETWELEVQSATRGEVVTIDLSELAAGPPGWARCLIDREQGTVTMWPQAATEGSDARPPLEREIVSFGPRPYRLSLVAGTDEYVTEATRQALAVPSRTVLDPNAPNPFRIATRIRFGLPRSSRVSLHVYGIQGERVATLMEDSRLEPGYHSLVWDGRKSTGEPAPSGIYLARLEAEGFILTRRLVLVR